MKVDQQWLAAVPLINSASASSRTLQPLKFDALPLGSVKPEGWMLGEMQGMASGLAGHEWDFYDYVSDSKWLYPPGTGGVDYAPLNAGFPYWLNGLVGLAYTLDDQTLKDQVHAAVTKTLSVQASDGWLGPEVGANRNFWSRIPFTLGLVQLVEANSTWEEPVVTALRKFNTLTNKMLKNNSEGYVNCNVVCTWAQARVHDLILHIMWLIENYPSDQDALLWENMDLFYEQDQYKWEDWYVDGVFEEVVDPSDASIFPYIHGVNVGQGLKQGAVIYRINGTSSLLDSAARGVNLTFTYHGSPDGSVLADEEERDLAPYMGSELCTAVETSFSLAYLYQAMGTNEYADYAERVMFNAFPAHMTGDQWAHQYMTEPNQPFAHNTSKPDGTVPPLYTTANSGVASSFGLEPEFPCCTVNHPQGYPKFTTNSWVLSGNDGLAHVLLSPSTVTTKVNGGTVTATCDTSYPFQNVFVYSVSAEKALTLYLRVPYWASNVIVTGISYSPEQRDSTTGLIPLHLPAGQSKIFYSFSASIRTEARSNDTVAVYYGNLLYALELGVSEYSTGPHAFNDPDGPPMQEPYPELRDYFLKNSTAWNVAIDPSTLQYHGTLLGNLPNPVFNQGAPPNYMTVEGCEIEWDLVMGVAPDWAPEDRTCISGQKTYKLIPYGSAKIHMSELPVTSFSGRS